MMDIDIERNIERPRNPPAMTNRTNARDFVTTGLMILIAITGFTLVGLLYHEANFLVRGFPIPHFFLMLLFSV